jgi:hypothetical protein
MIKGSIGILGDFKARKTSSCLVSILWILRHFGQVQESGKTPEGLDMKEPMYAQWILSRSVREGKIPSV